ncbi:hypothetical protein EKK58_11325 [Candidatus Dependentiae bacterium]|nr:MAG: hypothetical protein EKK58_11325 [Candidatus Dependentiae bacterium]
MITIYKNQINKISYYNDVIFADTTLLYRFRFIKENSKTFKDCNYINVIFEKDFCYFTIEETTSEMLNLGKIDLGLVHTNYTLILQKFDTGLNEWVDVYSDICMPKNKF